MQTGAAGATNSEQKRQHWTNNNQINKKQIGKFKHTFQENSSKKKGKKNALQTQ